MRMTVEQFEKHKRKNSRVFEGKEIKQEDGSTLTPVKIVTPGFRNVVGFVVVPAEA